MLSGFLLEKSKLSAFLGQFSVATITNYGVLKGMTFELDLVTL